MKRKITFKEVLDNKEERNKNFLKNYSRSKNLGLDKIVFVEMNTKIKDISMVEVMDNEEDNESTFYYHCEQTNVMVCILEEIKDNIVTVVRHTVGISRYFIPLVNINYMYQINYEDFCITA